MACVTLGAALFNFTAPLDNVVSSPGWLWVVCVGGGPLDSCASLYWLGLCINHYFLNLWISTPTRTHIHPTHPNQETPITEEEFRALFGLDLSPEELSRREQGSNHPTCPIVGCCRHARGTRPGWNTVRVWGHIVDQHLSGELPGRPPEQWLREVASRTPVSML